MGTGVSSWGPIKDSWGGRRPGSKTKSSQRGGDDQGENYPQIPHPAEIAADYRILPEFFSVLDMMKEGGRGNYGTG